MESILRLYLVPDPVDQHATYSVTNADAVSSVDDLQDGRALKVAYATWEDDLWLLGGNYHFIPATDAHVGYLSTGLTDSLGKTSTALGTIRLDLDAAYDLDEIIIHGSEPTYDYCTRVIVKYYNGATLLKTKTIYPNEVHFKFSEEVSGVTAIVFSFYDTNKPYRRIRVTDITFGDTVEFRASQIKNASVIMEQSPLSDELPFGTMQCELVTTEPMFDLIDPDSLYNQLTTRMMMDLLYDNGKTVDFIGRYYMANRSNVSDNHIKIEGMDLIGLLEDATYNGDFWNTDESFVVIVNRVLSFSSDIGTVTVDSDVASLQLRGNIEPGNVRTALQQALFAAGCSVEIVDGNNVHVMHQQFLDINAAPDGTITKSQKALEGQLIKDTTPATRLEVTSHSYVMAASATEIFKETLQGGTYTLYFDTPAYFSQDNVTNATLISSGPNYAIIEVSGTKEVVITGSEFSHNQVVSAREIDLTGLKPNTIKVPGATMISPDTAQTVLTRMEFYYLLRYEKNFRAFNPTFYKPGYIYHVDTIKDRKISMIMKQTQIDLSGGFVCDMSGVGVILGNVMILKKNITIGDKGNVIPAQFEYPREGPQSFVSTLFADYQEDYGIGVTINGIRTLYMDDSASFVLASSNANTSIAIDFQQIMKAITVGQRGTVTPAKFKFPWAASQNFTAKVDSAYLEDYGIGVSINGVRTLYMTTTKTFTLSNTTANTAVVLDFPQITKSISIGDKGTVTPAKFKFPMTTSQEFTVALLSGYSPNDYYISVNINGTVTDYREVSTKKFTLATTTANTNVAVTFPDVTKKSIAVGDKGTVTPATFKYPWNTAQTFTVQVGTNYLADYGISITINGTETVYADTTKSFTLATTDANTTVSVSFPVVTETITAGTGITVTPAKFRYPVTAEQSFTATNTSIYPYKYYVRITIDGTPTDYDITEKPFTLSNTTTNTTVAIASIIKNKRQTSVTSPWDGYYSYYGGVSSVEESGWGFYYPVNTTQVFNVAAYGNINAVMNEWTDANATFKWYVNDVLQLTHTQVHRSTFILASATSATTVSLVITDYSGGATGGGEEGGGGGYTPWTATCYANSVMRDSASPLGNFVASLGYARAWVQVTSQSDNDQWFYGTIIENTQYPNTVGLSGWISVSVVVNPEYNPN
jgi:hypothetical protein